MESISGFCHCFYQIRGKKQLQGTLILAAHVWEWSPSLQRSLQWPQRWLKNKNTYLYPSRSGSLEQGMFMSIWFFSFLPSIQSGPSAPMIEPLPFRVDLPSSFKSVGKCLPSHMQASLNPGKLSMKINHPQWLRSNPHCGRTLPCAPMSCVPSIRTECPIPHLGSYI